MIVVNKKKTKLMLIHIKLEIGASAVINTDKADRETEQTAVAQSVLAARLDGGRDPSRHCWLTLRGCKTGNNI